MATRQIDFRDQRPPEDIRAELEGNVRASFRPVPPQPRDPRLTYEATARYGTAIYRLLLRFEAALAETNCYSLRMEVSGGEASAAGWFDFWTRSYAPATPPKPGEGSEDQYRLLASQALAEEERLNNVEALQRTIIAAMHNGGAFSTCHKEGGTTIRFAKGRFVREDYGEWSDREEFHTEAQFLAFLRKFFHHQVTGNNYPDKPSEADAWKLILRLLEPARRAAAVKDEGPKREESSKKNMLWIAIPVALLTGLAYALSQSSILKVATIGSPIGRSLRTETHIATLIMSEEPYVPSLSGQRVIDTFRIGLVLNAIDGNESGRLIPAGRRVRNRTYQEPKILGQDGNLLWFIANDITAFNIRSGKLITVRDLMRANLSLPDIWTERQDGRFEFDQHLRVHSLQLQQTFEVNAASLFAMPVPAFRASQAPLRAIADRLSSQQPYYSIERDQSSGLLLSPSEWFGVHSPQEVDRRFKPGSLLERPRQRRRVYRGRRESMMPVGEEYLRAGLLCAPGSAQPIRLADPDGFLLTYYTPHPTQGTLVVARTDVNGNVLWSRDTGIGENIRQILPGTRRFGFIGRTPSGERTAGHEVLVMVDIQAGTLSTRSLRFETK